ncbi:MAG: alanine racemase [Candidatus Zixiibacteriota bacterium]|nr:MAG: alanine racemase [candidate division Zixibacteria bacterium]
MTHGSLGFVLQAAELLSRRVPRLDDQELRRFVQSLLDRREDFLRAIRDEGSPLYAIDTDTLVNRARQFRDAFSAVLPDTRVYYALKSNSHPTVATTLVREGLGLDVSSGLELESALNWGSRDIVFSGPGKRLDELKLAVDNADYVTVLIDSFSELTKLERIAGQTGVSVRAGVRLATDESGLWRKFGIPLASLSDFFEAASRCKHVDLCGLQFHISWNLKPESQVIFIARLGVELRQLEKKYRRSIRFIDVGGGFWPEQGEWLQKAATPQGIVQAALDEVEHEAFKHYKWSACSIAHFADHISGALSRQLPEDVKCTICLEPGRWLCNDAMHLLLTVNDVKSSDLIITDGGTNAVGWERFETDYFPVINLTRPDLREHECLVAGSLCTPHDIWGYSYFGQSIKEGDILLVPNQGAYTYSLRQEFIKPLPKCVELPTSIGPSNSTNLVENHGIKGQATNH